jgi:hypothetical protein
MEYKNLTPFSSMLYGAFNVHDEEFHAVALRAAYALVPARAATRGRGEALLTHDCVLRPADPFGAVVTADRYEGAVNESELAAESDLAAYKPRCDVLVRATSYAPGGAPSPRWHARLRVTTPRGRDAAVAIDKTLALCGPRSFVREGSTWSLGEPGAVTEVPVRWSRAYGGRSRVLSRDGHVALDAVCFTNPLGRGWIDARLLEACFGAGLDPPTYLPAPQVEDPEAPLGALDVSPPAEGLTDAASVARAAERYRARPSGLSCLGRAWTPRIQHAGTYDDAWLAQRHPFLPQDFSFRYWNAAPADQQIAHPTQGAEVELWNLTAPADSLQGYVGFALPAHRAFVMAFVRGLPIPVPGRLDTVVVDAEAMKVACVWRVLIPRALRPARLEARFEVNPEAPLLTLRGGD